MELVAVVQENCSQGNVRWRAGVPAFSERTGDHSEAAANGRTDRLSRAVAVVAGVDPDEGAPSILRRRDVVGVVAVVAAGGRSDVVDGEVAHGGERRERTVFVRVAGCDPLVELAVDNVDVRVGSTPGD